MAQPLPRRDIWLIPLIVLVTLILLLVTAEVVARIGWPEQITNSCISPDRALGHRYRPNCVSRMKAMEGPWYTNHYNECGYRSESSCGPVAPGVRRLAMIGASAGEGYLVEYPDTLGARLGADLTTFCARPVDVQNLSATLYEGPSLIPRMEEALALHPGAVVLTVGTYDIELQLDDANKPITGPVPVASAAPPPQAKDRSVNVKGGPLHQVALALRESRAFAVAQHFLFQNRAVYLPLYLRYADKADFLRPPFTAPWRERLRRFDILVGQLSALAHKEGVPLMLVFIPQQAEVAFMTARPPAGVDPEALPRALAAIAADHGVIFTDTSEVLRTKPNPERLYYTVDGHLSGRGQPIIARDVAWRLSRISDSTFAECRAAQVTSGQ